MNQIGDLCEYDKKRLLIQAERDASAIMLVIGDCCEDKYTAQERLIEAFVKSKCRISAMAP